MIILFLESLQKKLRNFIPNDNEVTLVCKFAYPGEREYRYKSIRYAKQEIKRVALKNYNAGFGYTFIGPLGDKRLFDGPHKIFF